jgi:hypothetical protein
MINHLVSLHESIASIEPSCQTKWKSKQEKSVLEGQTKLNFHNTKISSQKSENITKAISRVIAQDLRPLNFPYSKAFRNLLTILAPN